MPDLVSLFRPRSIALIGASPDPSIIRGRMVRAIADCAFSGPVYCVSRSHASIGGFPAVPSVDALPETVDLALITIPAEVVADALEACGRRGVRAAVIISSGFAEERGTAGRERQRRLTEIALRYDMAVLGPNGEGFMNALAGLTASFSPAVMDIDVPLLPPESRAEAVAVVSQSGGVGFSFFNRGRPKHMRFGYVVSTGNEAGLETLDVVEHLLEDEAIRTVLVFLEGLRTPARLEPVARRAAALGKPLIVAKMGRSEAGAQAAASHTASLAGSYRAYQAVFHELGIVPGHDVEEMVDKAALFAACADRLPAGRRVGVLTPSGGAGIWLADAAVEAGLEVPELDAATRARIDELLPAYGASRNPVDVTAQFIFRHGYSKALELLLDSPAIDAVLVACSLIHPDHLVHDLDNLRRVAAQARKPVVFCAYTLANPEAVRILSQAGFPCLTSMPNAAGALLALARYRDFQVGLHRRPAAVPVAPAAAPGLGGDALADRIRAAGPLLGEVEARRVLAEGGVPSGAGTLVASATAAVAAAREIAAPVALKVQSRDIAHKSDAGGVALDVTGDRDVADAYAAVLTNARAAHPDAVIAGVLVAAMAPPGVEMIVGVWRDPDFGPMLMVGLGGILVELFDDVAIGRVPVSRERAAAMLRELRGGTLLDGLRGAPAADREALAELMVAVSDLVVTTGTAIEELDLNPVIVHRAGQGVTVVDALIRTGAGTA